MTPSGSGGNSARVAIIVALITAIGVVLAALLGPQIIVNVNQQGQATAAAQLQPTIDSLREAPTPTAQIIEVTREIPITVVAERTVVVKETVVVLQTIEVTPAPTIQPTELPVTADGTILEVGQSWKSNGIELKLSKFVLSPNGLETHWLFRNNTGKTIQVRYGDSNFSAIDNQNVSLENAGFRFDRPGSSILQSEVSTLLESGNSIINTGADDKPLKFGYQINCQATEIIVTASEISSIGRAQWRIPVPSCG
jgi:hypothetical protein